VKDLVNAVKWWWLKRCPQCGGALQLRAHIACKGADWIMITKEDQVCLDCGAVKEK
jgi:hypothetical protein